MDGYNVVKAIEACGSKTGATSADVMIADCGVLQPSGGADSKGPAAPTASSLPAGAPGQLQQARAAAAAQRSAAAGAARLAAARRAALGGRRLLARATRCGGVGWQAVRVCQAVQQGLREPVRGLPGRRCAGGVGCLELHKVLRQGLHPPPLPSLATLPRRRAQPRVFAHRGVLAL